MEARIAIVVLPEARGAGKRFTLTTSLEVAHTELLTRRATQNK